MRNEPWVWPEVRDAGTSGAGAVPLRSAQLMGQQKKKEKNKNEKKMKKKNEKRKKEKNGNLRQCLCVRACDCLLPVDIFLNNYD